MNFMERLHMTINNKKKITENGATGYETTGKALVDLNFAVASLRNMSEAEIVKRFIPAFYEDRILAMKWLFFLRDIRGGMGERRSFRIIVRYLAEREPGMIGRLVEVMAEYGRYDDLLCLFDTPLEKTVLAVLAKQLREDIAHKEEAGKISLCAKWMPGNNTSSQEARKNAAKIQQFMGMTAKEYRQMLAALRAYADVTEVYMSSNRWDEIDYTCVASRANLLYRKAFLLRDQARRQEELPGTVLVISDMEFDAALRGCGVETLFETIGRHFAGYGYRMPKLVFWNVNSRTNVIPVRENELGVGLVSGFSLQVCKMVLSNELDPFRCLKKTLDSERYRKVEDRLCS